MKKKIKYIVLMLLLILCTAGAAISGSFLFGRINNYRKSSDEYIQIKEQAVKKLSENESGEETLEATENLPLEIDWEKLEAINPDIIGWIFIPCLDISYPIMQTDDNEYYLHRTMEESYLYAGSIFADCSNSPDFTDPHTIIYGHNMKDGSMFGKLWHITYRNAASEDPYFWIFTPQKNYRYKIFSSFETASMSEAYKLFEKSDEEFMAWIKKMKEMSYIDTDILQPDREARVVTLSTCSGTGSEGERTIVQGIRESTPTD